MTDDSAARIEAQEYYVRRFEKARTFRLSGQTDRRKAVFINNEQRPETEQRKRHSWGPHHWQRNDPVMAYRRLGGSLAVVLFGLVCNGWSMAQKAPDANVRRGQMARAAVGASAPVLSGAAIPFSVPRL